MFGSGVVIKVVKRKGKKKTLRKVKVQKLTIREYICAIVLCTHEKLFSNKHVTSIFIFLFKLF